MTVVTFEAAVEDQVAVGTEEILESPHVSEGPGRIANAPVPSVFADDRGQIHRLRVGGKRINLLYSKADVMRSGYLHPNVTHDFVVSGTVEVWILTKKSTEKKIHKQGTYFTIDPYVPHILHFIEDTILAEWWDPGAFKCWYYHPYRRIIDVQNCKLSTSLGQFQRLVPSLDGAMPIGGTGSKLAGGLGKLLWLSTGVAIGVWVGALAFSGPRRR